MLKQHKDNRRRLQDAVARKLGITPNKGKRYRLNKEQLKAYSKLDMHNIKRLFFDIETSPMIVYTWRTGYNVNLPYDNIIEDWRVICISYKWEDEDKVHHLTWDKDKCDKKMLQKFIKQMNKADECIAHNGDRFDIKKIRTRCIKNGIPMFPKYRTLDTLKKARGGFAFNSNRLDDLGQELGVGGKHKHEGFQMWVKCMNGDKEALKEMVKYCDIDVLLLESVYLSIQSYVKPNTHVGVHNGNLKHSCPTCGSENTKLLKNDVTEKGTISRVVQCGSCEHVYNISNSAWLQFLKFKAHNII